MYARGKFGIEYTPPPPDEDTSFLRRAWPFFAFAFAAWLAYMLYARLTAPAAEPEEAPPAVAAEAPDAATDDSDGDAAVVDVAPSVPAPAPSRPIAAPPTKPPPAAPVPAADVRARPQSVVNLLLKINEARRTGNLEMEISAIERLRTLPGNPAADLDDKFAVRLGELNMRKLFKLKSPLWVKDVAVRSGDSASRIAFENGSTLASLERLNGAVSKLRVGQKLKVMDHPRFILVVRRRSRTADLSLNGKFFRRYQLPGEVKGPVGAYATPERIRPIWTACGIPLRSADRTELELLLPKGSSILISEL